MVVKCFALQSSDNSCVNQYIDKADESANIFFLIIGIDQYIFFVWKQIFYFDSMQGFYFDSDENESWPNG